MPEVAGLLSGMVSGQPLAGIRANPMTSSSTATNGAAGTSGSSSGITANDFLTLLVTEMKNQDPTANTDPNEYINQLVNVNSLQQLISINETLKAALGSSTSGDNTRPTAQAAVVNASSNSANSSVDAAMTQISGTDNGNLSVPEAQPAAVRLAHALDGHMNTPLTK